MASSRAVPCPEISSAERRSTCSASDRPSRRTGRSSRASSHPPVPQLRVSPDQTPPSPLSQCLAAPASDPRPPLCSTESASFRRSVRGEVIFTRYSKPSSPSLPARQATLCHTILRSAPLRGYKSAFTPTPHNRPGLPLPLPPEHPGRPREPTPRQSREGFPRPTPLQGLSPLSV